MPKISVMASSESKSYNHYDWNIGVTEHERDGKLVLEVDTDKAEFHRKPWKTLGDFGKRKWENWLFLNSQRDGLKVVFCYKP